jgi:hypothetical protein
LNNPGVVITFEDIRELYKKRLGSMGKFLLFLGESPPEDNTFIANNEID